MAAPKRSASAAKLGHEASVSQGKIKRTFSTPGALESESAASSPASQVDASSICCFKNPGFVHSGAVKSGRKRNWRSLRQVAASERAQLASRGHPSYAALDAPPSFKPQRKYSDISGLPAKYTDPHTGIWFASAEEYRLVKQLAVEVVQGYKALRSKAAFPA